MISHRQMAVIWLKGIVWTSKEATDVESVILPGIEVRVVADVHGQMQRHLLARDQGLFLEALVVLQDFGVGCVLGEDVLEVFPDRAMGWSSQCGEVIESRLGEHRDVK